MDSSRLVLAFAWAALALMVPAGGAAQQPEPPLQGVVADHDTNTPVASATVTLTAPGLAADGIRTRTASDGTFAFSDVPRGFVTLRVSADGYPDLVEEVEVPADAVLFVQFYLQNVAAVLADLLVAAGQQPDEADIREARTAAEILAQRVPGTGVHQGVVGRTNYPIRLRGVNSVILSGTPAVFIDGVRISNMREAYDILTQIPAADVANIQVLRGPATAFLHGDAANGVILVETRSGRPR